MVVKAIGSLQEVMRWDLEDIDAYLGILRQEQMTKAAQNTYQMRDSEQNGRR
jgi:hypothetical protein